MLIRKKLKRTTVVFIMCLVFFVGNTYAQTSSYTPPRCKVNNPNGSMSNQDCTEGYEGIANPETYDIVWQKDGSVIVNNDVTFISGIKIYKSNKLTFPIYESDMLLVSPEDFHNPASEIIGWEYEEDYVNDGVLKKYPIYGEDTAFNAYKEGLGIISKDLTESGITKVEMFRRSNFIETNASNNPSGDFMFNLEDNEKAFADLLYGSTTNNNVNAFTLHQVPFDAYGYYSHGFSGSQTFIESTNFSANWNKPKSATWADTIEDVIIVASVIVTAGAALEIELPAMGLSTSLFSTDSYAINQGLKYSTEFFENRGTSLWRLRLSNRLILGTRRSSMIKGLSVLGAFTAADAAYSSNTSFNTFNAKNIELKDVNSIVLPQETSLPPGASDEEKALQKVYNNFRNYSKNCPPNLNLPGDRKCHNYTMEPTVVKMKANNAHIEALSLPGASRDIIRPYQLFKENMWYYSGPGELQDQYLIPHNGTDQVSQKTILEVVNSVDAGTLLRTVFEGDGDFDLVIEASEIDKEASFFVYSHGQPNFGNQKIISHKLGRVGIHTATNKYLDLYKCYVLGELNQNTVNVTLSSNGSTPLYLTGDNIVIKNYAETDLLFVGPNTENFFTSIPLVYEDANGNPVTTNKPETHVVVSGAVAILDEDVVDSDAEINGTEKFGLYVGKVGDAESGILANNVALLNTYVLPDFVFEEDYSLMSLFELEEYVKHNKHLPNILSQEDYKKQGFYSVQKMMYGQLQNLEELYLHAIDQEESLNALDTKTKDLKLELQNIENKLQQLEKHN
ncbi:hypothetical protein KORDIASMS9_02928 [Kordia sp. SMS9]|uniref:hypothetical protein n=1 Tax=Kordia sp. SMS9 TaxID=2282170 RepID=UPI000E10A5B3|nr:hypothetical protein [Kordia sp. SMS9]AXG70682.1 hypothetical protein KORDIASMS9_02928 [Kordia sp. SMS9]